MKAGSLVAGLFTIAVLGGCATKPGPDAAPTPARPLPRPLVVMPPPAPPAEWIDLPLTAGGWSYSATASGSQARFAAAEGETLFLVRCDRARGRVSLSRSGSPTDYLLRVTTSTAARPLSVEVEREPRLAIGAALGASDPLLDAIAFSRGRFMVEAAGLPRLVIPAWPEPARVVEDCRG